LTVQLCDRLLQHLAMTRVAGGLQLLSEAFSGKKQAFAFPVAFLLVGGKRCAGGFPLLDACFLLLFYRLAFPAACHLSHIIPRLRLTSIERSRKMPEPSSTFGVH